MSKEKIKKQLIKTVKCQYFNVPFFDGKKETILRQVDRLVLIYRNEDTKEKFFEVIDNPQLTYYLTKEDRLLENPVNYIPIDDVDPFVCSSTDVVKSVHYNLGLDDLFWNNIREKKFNNNNAILLNPNVHGADIDIEDFYIGKHYEEYPISDSNNYFTKSFFDIEVDSLKSLGFPEAEKAECPVNAISFFYDENMTLIEFLLNQPENKSQQEFKKHKKEFKERIIKKYKDEYGIDIKLKITFFDEEENLISSFFNVIHELKPDFCGAWNLTNFDIQYLVNRLQNLGFVNNPDIENGKDVLNSILCCDEIPYSYQSLRLDTREQDPADKNSYFQCVDYTNWVDMLLLFANLRKSFGKRDSYALDDIAKEEIGAEKLHFKDPNTTIKNSCWMDFEEFTEYSIHDSVLLYLIEKKNNDFNMLYTIAAKTETRITKALKKTVCIKNLARRFYYDKGYIMSDNHNTSFGEINRKEKKEFRGAFVADPNLIQPVGTDLNGLLSKYLFDNVIDFDLSSLYPSIILAFNVDATTQYGFIDLSYYKNRIDELNEKITECEENNYDELEDYKQELEKITELYDTNIYTHYESNELMDDLVTRSYIDIGVKYIGLPSISEALNDLS